MIAHCARCGAGLDSGVQFCPQCGLAKGDRCADADDVADSRACERTGRDALIQGRLGPAGWGIGPPALGLLALVPTAALVSLLALTLPLGMATAAGASVISLAQLALVWALATREWPPNLLALGLKPPRIALWRAGVLVVLTLGASLGFSQLYAMATLALGLDFLVPDELPSGLLLPGGLAALSVIALAVLTPVAEEVFFRGFLMRGFVNRWGVVAGIVLSAAVFACLHFQPAVILPVFVTGLLLGSLYWQTGSIWPCIGVHAAQNLIASVGLLLGW